MHPSRTGVPRDIITLAFPETASRQRPLPAPNETTISVIIPVHNGGDGFRTCLESLKKTDPPPLEIIVVADGDRSGSRLLAEEWGARVLTNTTPKGPGAARNLGARHAAGNILFFVDADVAVAPDAVGRIKTAFEKDPALAALFGSYDDAPSQPNFLSQYKNLFHHWVHQTAKQKASTFWSACGAIRRDTFVEIGGFDEAYRRRLAASAPGTVEDIEMGYRLRNSGYPVQLHKDLKVKHLKQWTVRSLLEADILHRAVPWSRLILREGRFINDLNTKVSDRISVLLMGLSVIMGLASLFVPWGFVAVMVLLGAMLWLNRDLYRFFKDKRGVGFAIKSIFWHWFYLFYSGMTFVLLWGHDKGKKGWDFVS
jgi:GT2 family glycosyltransferase